LFLLRNLSAKPAKRFLNSVIARKTANLTARLKILQLTAKKKLVRFPNKSPKWEQNTEGY